MAVGCTGALIIGLSNPAFNVFFGDMIDALNRGSTTFTELVAQLCIRLVALACISIFAGFLQVSNTTRTCLLRICPYSVSVDRYIAGHVLASGRPRSSANST
jgi:threonine/homoserine/homoserine lactone efflux protein